MKFLFWDPDGFVLYYKRLERGTFNWVTDLDLSEGGEIESMDFAMILTGINDPKITAKPRSGAMTPKPAPLSLV